ncbi:MAG: hypothetical protein IKV64_00785 [Clostridia bacterium]|nr:hypothetical protein [Clostridia bacterium]
MWLTVCVSHNYDQIKKLLSFLHGNNILTKVIRRQSDEIFYEVFVPYTELEEAQNNIFECGLFN